MLDGEITDMIEAQSLRHNRDYIDIYSSSWGPEDDGKTVDGPGDLTEHTLAAGAKLVSLWSDLFYNLTFLQNTF